MEFKLTIDITDKLADAISALSASIADARKCHTASVTENVAQIVGKVSSASLSSHKEAPQCAQEAPECTKEPEPVITQADPESAKIAPAELQDSASDEGRIADCAGAQFHCPTPAQPLPAVNKADAVPEPQEKQEPEKPKKKKSAKKAAETPAPAEAPQPEAKPQPEPPVVEATEKPEPAKAEPVKPDEPKAADGDPMGGMTVMEAVQALFDAIQQKGLEMADVNARVRAKANELGLSYSSIACLIKAIGYVEARRIALGE